MDEQLRAKLPPAYVAEFDRLGKDSAAFTKKRNRKLRWWAVVCGMAFVVTLAVAINLIAAGSATGPEAAAWMVALNAILFAYLFGNLFFVFPGNAEHRRKEIRRDKLDADALTVANEHGRQALTGDREEWTTIRGSQHQWYGDHSELNWRDRERAQSMGLDVETYVSNVLDRE
ncbi:hypothetical protein RCH23_002123 [Cryobacterium sp. CAN_C3]|uniref:hypothetical protein n=1 Tax=unclassified Cryobacterium TaxID=2649013 RepID=UPI0018CBC7D6|nr:hypothetical protein [Cryobacterium sp. CAN_C3]MEC5154738.1 hypothetical protein [Cryobacterium sp. CAN_C3]